MAGSHYQPFRAAGVDAEGPTQPKDRYRGLANCQSTQLRREPRRSRGAATFCLVTRLQQLARGATFRPSQGPRGRGKTG
ncbi:hypothetical protein BDV12DRAFT_180451 [Aspergillus spectabilis]